MQDYYGNEYIESGRWWPFSYWFNRTQARATAISKWLRRVVDGITQRFPDAEIKQKTRPVGPGDIVWTDVKVRIKSVGGLFVVSLTGTHYDTLTGSGLDPVEWVRNNLAGQKWLVDHGVRPPRDYGWGA